MSVSVARAEQQSTDADRSFVPIFARTTTIHRPVEPVAYDCVALIFVRSGSAFLLSEFGECPVAVGDVAALGVSTLCASEPEGWITTTTIYLDRDYLVDQVFWQHAALLTDRLDAQDFMDKVYAEPAQVLRLGEDRVGMLMPWLDELVALSVAGPDPEHFYRMQALLFAVLDVLVPFVNITSAPASASQRAWTVPAPPRHRRFRPLRVEAAVARDLLHGSPAEPWTLGVLAERVHLSPKQLMRVFVEAYGKTPLAYLTMLRVEHMARLLREGELSISAAGRAAGWSSRSRAAEAFRQCVGVTPQRYRARVLAATSG
ncbi:helix-turn-helix transcriptional regulator [Pseudonocardia sp. RS010]|uniref:helix-turn-helix transcriptional regulator n=1 Tax=Pseudonocardia sp. RS010 TaxID=3385979 RepID=UPI0039A320F3